MDIKETTNLCSRQGFILHFWTYVSNTYTHFKKKKRKRIHTISFFGDTMKNADVTVCLSLDLASIYVYAKKSLYLFIGFFFMCRHTFSSMIQKSKMCYEATKSSGTQKKTRIYCCAFFLSCDFGLVMSNRKNCVGRCLQDVESGNRHKSLNNTTKKEEEELAATVCFMDRRLNLIAFIYIYISLFLLQHENVSCSHCHSFILTFFGIFFSLAVVIFLSCVVFFFRFEELFASSFRLVVVVYPFWIWCVYALNWYIDSKITHIVANMYFFFFSFAVIFYLWLGDVVFTLSASTINRLDFLIQKTQNNESPFFFHSCAAAAFFRTCFSIFFLPINTIHSKCIYISLLLVRILMMQCIQHAVACAHFLRSFLPIWIWIM